MKRGIVFSIVILMLAAAGMLIGQSSISGGGVTSSGAITSGHCASFASSTVIQDSGGTCGGGGSGTVTNIATTSPIGGGPITTTGTLTCTTCTTNASALTSGQVLVGGGGQAAAADTNLSESAGTLSIGVPTSIGGAISLAGATSGTATITGPAVAGTSTNPVVFSNVIQAAAGTVSSPSYNFTASANSGMFKSGVGAGGPVMVASGTPYAAFTAAGTELGVQISPGSAYCWANATIPQIQASSDTCFWRPAQNLLSIGANTSGSGGFLKSTGQTLAVTAADVTCGTGGTLAPCTSLTTITGLSVTLPSSAQTWAFECDLIVGQATSAAADQIGVQTATNAPTNLAATATAYTAAAVSTSASITGVSSTTAQSVITFTPGGTGTKLPVHLAGTVEGSSASGTTLNIMALTGAAADLLTIYRGSHCWIH